MRVQIYVSNRNKVNKYQLLLNNVKLVRGFLVLTWLIFIGRYTYINLRFFTFIFYFSFAFNKLG
jgi:hypothetical protein